MNGVILGMALSLALSVSGALAGINGIVSAEAAMGSPVIEEMPVAIADLPTFLMPKKAGVFIAVNVPYDLFYTGKKYYLYQEEWYAAASFSGPWTVVEGESLPMELRRQRLEVLRVLRDKEVLVYEKQGNLYRGKIYIPVVTAAEDTEMAIVPDSHSGNVKK